MTQLQVLKTIEGKYYGRMLIEQFGYKNWQNFEAAVERARTRCRFMHENPDEHFEFIRHQPNSHNGRGRPAADVLITSYGVYQLVLVCDISKPEVQEAMRFVDGLFEQGMAALRQRDETPQEPVVLADDSWWGRTHKLLDEHMTELVTTKAYRGCFTVFSQLALRFGLIEKELARHLIQTTIDDRPDISVGRCWAHHRRTVLGVTDRPMTMALRNLHASPDGPDRVVNDVAVYRNKELPAFLTWFDDVYMRVNVVAYFDKKFTTYHQLTRVSAADASCKRLTGQSAELSPTIRGALTAAGGFAPARGELAHNVVAQLPPSERKVGPARGAKKVRVLTGA